jgi:hypothetical protein
MPSRTPPPPLSPLPFLLHGEHHGWARRAASLQSTITPAHVDPPSRDSFAAIAYQPSSQRPPGRIQGYAVFMAYGLAIGALGGLLLFRGAPELDAPASTGVPEIEVPRAPHSEPQALPPAAPVADPAATTSAQALPPAPAPRATATPPAKPVQSEPEQNAPDETAPSPAETPTRPFDRQAAESAVRHAAAGASVCGRGGQAGTTRVSVRFAPSGRATLAVVESGSPFSGSAVGSCIATHLRGARVPPFDGSFVTVHATVHVN